jgi:hypothetical protein
MRTTTGICARCDKQRGIFGTGCDCVAAVNRAFAIRTRPHIEELLQGVAERVSGPVPVPVQALTPAGPLNGPQISRSNCPSKPRNKPNVNKTSTPSLSLFETLKLGTHAEMATQQEEAGVPFSVAHEMQQFRLLELPPELLELLEAPSPPQYVCP